MKKNTYRVYWSNTENAINGVCQMETTSELNARIIALRNCKQFGPGCLRTQREYVREWRGRYITKVEVV